MDTNQTPKRIHPLVAGAAVSVILVSLVGVAAMTGLLPSSRSTEAPVTAAAPQSATEPQVAAAAAVQPVPAPQPVQVVQAPVAQAPAVAPQPAVTPKPAQPKQTAQTPAPVAKAPAAPAVCKNCGKVTSVKAVQQEGQGTGLGVVAGAVIGGVLGNQVGGGTGKKVATVAGAVGGGYAGNEIEKRARSATIWEVNVKMEDGSTQTFTFDKEPKWRKGDRVRVSKGKLKADKS